MKKALLLCLILSFFSFSPLALAQGDSLALSVTPPLVNINLTPGQEISLDVTVINNNDHPLKVYIEAVDFRKNDGKVEFLRNESAVKEDGEAGMNLSSWITLSRDEVELSPFQAEKIPFVISVPQGASPGGHYAALLIGPGAPDDKVEGAMVKVTSKMSSLILARVEGKVDERGMIREFSPAKHFSSKAETNFKVRFENLGNVHLRPQGVIKVVDMFGKQKGGDVEFNYKKDYGNVLPGETREFSDDIYWRDDDFFLLNRYKAELAVSFGGEAKETDNRYAFFWVIDWKWLLTIVLILVGFIISLFLFVKIYVKKSVSNLQREFGVLPQKRSPRSRAIARPRRPGTVDLRKIKKDE